MYDSAVLLWILTCVYNFSSLYIWIGDLVIIMHYLTYGITFL